jgi:hypothetical protein
MGHLTAVGSDAQQAIKRVTEARANLKSAL